MATTAAGRSIETPAARAPTAALLLAIALAGVVASAASVALALRNPSIGADLGEPLVVALLHTFVTTSYVLCGLVAWVRRPASRLGPLMLVAGFVNFLTSLSWSTWPVTFTLGQALDLVPPVLFLHVFLAFPTGYLCSRLERTVVTAAYVVAVALELVRMMLGGFGPDNVLEVTSNLGASDAVTYAQLSVISAACLWGVGVLALRRRRAGRPLRRWAVLLVDAFALGLVMIAFLFLSHVFGGPAIREIRWAMFITLGLAPFAFLIGVLQSRLARSAVADLLVELRSDRAAADLRDALARALRDPSVSLAYWLPDYGMYVDLGGRPVDLAAEDARRATTFIDVDGAHVAALMHDPSLEEEPELLDAAVAAAGLALENARLQAELRARLEELHGSRARILEAGQKERQRLERNLHDGAQQRLIALSLELGMLEEAQAKAETKKRLERARREIATSLEELRAVARGLHPAVVTGHGLEVALEQLTARAPVPVELRVDVGRRLPEALEVAAFYLVSESLANIGKHASATSATVEVSRVDGRVTVEVSDDGVGGADTERGSGLRGLADRVEALDGRLRIWSPVGGGTRLRAEIPCAS